jgi:DNA polymerase-3 subunit delta'
MKFSEIPGQHRIKNHLIRTVKNNRVSHAQLFTGPAGVGKFQLAIAFAQFISCTNRQYYDSGPLQGDSCGTCPSCVKYAKVAHPDLHLYFPVSGTRNSKKLTCEDTINDFRNFLLQHQYFVDIHEWYEVLEAENKQGLIGAEDCNDMIRKLGLKSYESEYKVVIIWHADKMFHAAAPKILKILEEPPAKTLFILLAEQTELMLNTILSRTQILKIPKLSEREIAEELVSRFDVSEAESRRIALLSDGNLKLAMSMVGDGDDDHMNYQLLSNWLRLCYRKDVLGLLKFAEDNAKIGREKQKQLLAYGLRVIRRCLLFNFRLDGLVKLDGEEREFVYKLSRFIHPGNGNEMAAEFNKALLHIERNGNSKIVFFDLSFQMLMLMHSK